MAPAQTIMFFATVIYGKNNTYILAWSVDSANDSTDKAFVTKLTKKINEIMDR